MDSNLKQWLMEMIGFKNYVEVYLIEDADIDLDLLNESERLFGAIICILYERKVRNEVIAKWS